MPGIHSFTHSEVLHGVAACTHDVNYWATLWHVSKQYGKFMQSRIDTENIVCVLVAGALVTTVINSYKCAPDPRVGPADHATIVALHANLTCG